MREGMITVVAANPAMDEVLFTPNFCVGRTNRFQKRELHAGGKGYNVAQALVHMGVQVRLIGFLPEENGAIYSKAVSSLGVSHSFVPCAGTIRFNTKILDGQGVLTEVNRSGFGVEAEQMRALAQACAKAAQDSALMLFCGSLPDGMPTGFYAEMADSLCTPVMVDTSGEALRAVLNSKAILIKPNLDEFSELIGRNLQTVQSITSAARTLSRECSMMLAISLGKQGMVLSRDGAVWYAKAPADVCTRTPVGAGDHAFAAMAYAWTKDGDIPTLLKWGTAAGTAWVYGQRPETLREKIVPIRMGETDKVE